MIPLFDAAREYQADADALEAAALAALRSGRYILGPEVAEFEQACARYLGVPHSIGCASGTDALLLALRAANVGPGDTVLTTPLTFFATASAIAAVGARPIFCDIEPTSYCMDPAAVDAAIDGSVKAIIPVHLYGQSADLAPILDVAAARGVVVIEDAAQSFGSSYGGAKTGTIGDLGCYSFFPTKTLGAFGDGGMVVTHDEDVADRLALLRAHGARPKYHHHILGTNSRLDTVQAAMLHVRLATIDARIARRQAIAARYDALLCEAPVIRPERAPGRDHSFHQYVIRVTDRDDVQAALAEAGIGTAVYYEIPLHLQPALAHLGHQRGGFPVAEQVADEVLALPIFPTLTDDEVDAVGAAVVRVTSR